VNDALDMPIDREAWARRLAKAEDPCADPRIVDQPQAEGPRSVDIRLLTAGELARELGLAPRTIRRLDLERRLPRPVRIGRAVRWIRSEIAAWQRAGCPGRDEWVWRPERN